MVGRLLDNRYQLTEKIGSGGMADVYRAQDVLLDRVVAVKILHSNFATDNDFVVRFRREAQAAAKLLISMMSARTMMCIISSWNTSAVKR